MGVQSRGDNRGRITNTRDFGKFYMETFYCRNFVNIYTNACYKHLSAGAL